MECPSSFYKHPVKHRIFTSYGLQNRNPKELELIKQACLYIGELLEKTNKLRNIREEEVYGELKHAIRLFNQLAVRNIEIGMSVSKDLKIVVSKFAVQILAPAISDLVPAVAKDLSGEFGPFPVWMNILEAVKQHPLLFTEMIVDTLPSDHKISLREIQPLSYREMLKLLGGYLEKA